VDVWWGIVEAQGPRNYNWQPYVELMELCQSLELTVEAVMSFHACGGNVGDTVNVPLPLWVVKAASAGGLFFTDQAGFVNLECLSLFSDEVPGLEGRTPVDCYHDFMVAFVSAMDAFMGNTLVLVCVGMGPCGELRYPSYPMQDSRWRFPGVGEFQSFDKHAATQLAEAAGQCGHPEWGRKPGPHDAGGYTSKPEDTGFFCSGGSMHGEYGQFFLKWYSGALVAHGRRMLEAASRAFGSCASGGRRVPLGVKLAGIHWHYLGSHAAELTAGYYNVLGHNGYPPPQPGRSQPSQPCCRLQERSRPLLSSPEGLSQQPGHSRPVATARPDTPTSLLPPLTPTPTLPSPYQVPARGGPLRAVWSGTGADLHRNAGLGAAPGGTLIARAAHAAGPGVRGPSPRAAHGRERALPL